MTDTAKEEKAPETKKAAKPADLSDYEKFMAEHADLVEARKAAEQAVWDHRQSPLTEKLKAMAEADDAAKKKATAPKAAPKKEQFDNPYKDK